MVKVRQFKDLDGCYSYIVYSGDKAMAIDVSKNTSQYIDFLKENGLGLEGIVDTHIHADHLTGAGDLREKINAPIIMSKNHNHQLSLGLEKAPEDIQELLRTNAGVKVDKYVDGGDHINFGKNSFEVLECPGHTLDLISLYTPGAIFSGDSLHINGIARTDLPGGDNKDMYHTLGIFKSMPKETVLYPGHDYNGNIMSVLGYESINNHFMRAENLDDLVKLIDKSFGPIKPGMSCSANIAEVDGDLSPMAKSMCLAVMNYIENAEDYLVTPQDLSSNLEEVFLLDVRTPEEFSEEYISNAINIPAGPETFPTALTNGVVPKDKKVIAYCRSGSRSTLATMYLRTRGFDAYSLKGGIEDWKDKGFEVE